MEGEEPREAEESIQAIGSDMWGTGVELKGSEKRKWKVEMTLTVANDISK